MYLALLLSEIIENENMTHGICTSPVIDALIVGTTVTRKHHLVTNAFIWKESKLLLRARLLFFLWMCHYRNWKMLSHETVRQFKREKILEDQRNLTENASLVIVCYYINTTPAEQPLKGELFPFKILKINTSLV